MKRRKNLYRNRVCSEDETKGSHFRSSFHRSLVFSAIFVALSLGGYLFSVNRNAVSGYSMRLAEKNMAELSDESQKLRIREAELRSLYGLEEASARLDMVPITESTSVDEPGPIAYGGKGR
ncbi:MAG: hypothetical protein IPL87_03990 [Candidatus Moraniibacteriota bacterium]|nr:MAG: hypothetical protein IPL87_03990 [Candidatus Moranbacteria bacterium]